MLDKCDFMIIKEIVEDAHRRKYKREFKGLSGASLVSSIDEKLGKEVMAVNAVIMTFIAYSNEFAKKRPFKGNEDIVSIVLESWDRRGGFEENFKKTVKRYLTPNQQEILLELYDYLKVIKPENEAEEAECEVQLLGGKIADALRAVARNFEPFFYGCDVYDRIAELNRLVPEIRYGGEENIPLLELPLTQPQYRSLCMSIYKKSFRQMYSDKKNGYTVGDMLEYIKDMNEIKGVSPNAVIVALDKAGIKHPYGKAKEKPKEKYDDEVVEFIRRRFDKDCHWLDRNCYYFAMMLKARFPQAVLYYDVIDCHFLSKIDGKFYDWKGLRETGDNTLVEWDKFAEYDKNRMQAVIRGCIE